MSNNNFLEFINQDEKNYLRTNKFQVVFSTFNNVTYNVTSLVIPGLTLGEVQYSTRFRQVPYVGDNIEYDPFEMSFLIDKKMINYLVLYGWMKGIGFPEESQQYTDIRNYFGLQNDKGEPTVNATVLVHDSDMTPLMSVEMRGLFPVSLSGINLTHTSPAFQNGIQATATFKFQEIQFMKPQTTEVIV